MKKISVIIPVYNAEKYIEATLESLLAQSYRELEIIAVDDGSSDSTPDILGAVASRDERVRVVRLENGGASRARNVGLDIASGEYIGFADADDLAMPTLYESLCRALEDSGADMAQCGFTVESAEGCESAYCFEGVIECPERSGRALMRIAPAVWCKLLRKEIIGQTRFDSAYRVGEDMLFNLDILKKAKRIALVGAPLYRYMQREGSICSSAPSKDTLLSYRRMTDTAMRTYADSPCLRRLIKSLRLLDGGGIASRAVRFFPEEGKDILREVVKETRRNLSFVLFRAYLPLRERLKLCYIALMPRAYRRKVLKKHAGG